MKNHSTSLVFCFIVMFSAIACKKQEKLNGRSEGVIYIDVFQKDYYTVNGKHTPDQKLQETIFNEIQEIEKLGFKKDEIVVDMAVNPETKMGRIVDLQTTIRDLGVRKVMYQAPDTQDEKKDINL